MTEQGSWHIEKKVRGQKQVHANDRWNPHFRAALRQMAARESAATGKKVSASTLLTNLATRNGNWAAAKRSELRRNYIQLKKENKHGTIKPKDSDTQGE